MGTLTRLVLAACLVASAAAAAIDDYMYFTDDAVIIEAADLYDTARSKRQSFAGWPASVIPPGWPGLPAGVPDRCSTPDGRSGTCKTRSACRWTRDMPEVDLNSLDRSLGFCIAGESTSPRGEPAVRGVCCPGETATPAPPAAATQWWQTTQKATAAATQWWQTTQKPTTTTQRATPGRPAATQWWQTTKRPTTARPTTQRPTTKPASVTQWWQTTRRPAGTTERAEAPTLAPGIPAFITHAWQATKGTTSRPPAAPTHWWQSTAAPGGKPTTQKPTTKPPAGTQWWQTTKRPTQKPTTKPPSATQWWQTTKKPTTQRTTTAPAATQWWETTTKKATTAATQAPPSSGGSGAFSACGTRSTESDRIVGGTQAVKGEFPWLAGIFKSGRQFCGGSLIDKRHILTAAHCVAHMSAYDVSQLLVRLGDYDISTPFEAKHDTYKVARVVRHKGFSQQTLHTDIAIITLSKDVKFKTNIRPICLDRGSDNHAGDIVTVAGWGSLREGGRQPSIVQKVSLKVWKNSDCKRTYGPQAPGGIIDSMLCAGRQGKDSCSGDSGGPLMKISGTVYQVGVVSWGIGCGKAEFPGVYTRVAKLIDWIERNRKEF